MSLTMCLAVTAGVVSADVPTSNRSLTYQPLNADLQKQNPPQNRSISYEPVQQIERPVINAPNRHVVERPLPEPQENSATSRSPGNRYSRNAATDKITAELLDLPLPKPVGQITDPDTRKQLDYLSQKIATAKTAGISGNTVQVGDTTPSIPPTGIDGNTPSPPSVINTGQIFVERIFQDENNWYARIDGDSSPISLDKQGDRYYRVDGKGNILAEVILRLPDLTAEDDKSGATSILADDQSRKTVLLIVTTMSVLAVIGVGYLAFDYKLRWEHEIASQNNRLIGHGTLGELDLTEPETLSFSHPDFRSPDDSFDHSFRTIA